MALFVLEIAVAVFMFTRLVHDTSSLSLGAFGIVAALSAVAFSYAPLLDEEPAIKDRVVFAGERLLLSAIFLGMSAGLKFGAVWLASVSSSLSKSRLFESAAPWGYTLGALSATMFLFAVIAGHNGVVNLYRLLLGRYRHHWFHNTVA